MGILKELLRGMMGGGHHGGRRGGHHGEYGTMVRIPADQDHRRNAAAAEPSWRRRKIVP